MIRLQLNQISKTHSRGGRPAVHDVSFALEEGGILALVGESGSGKSTLLRLIAGLDRPDAGTISLGGEELSSPRRVVAPEHREIGLVFQHHALFPHLTVERNVAFGLRKMGREERSSVVRSMLNLVGLSGFERRYPHELSGGERQRIALARSLAPNPRLLLLDEPFSSLDVRLRRSMRDETLAILRERKVTAVLVTHDTEDALSVAGRLVVLREGEIQQAGTPEEVYRTPASAYVATLFGECNFLPLSRLPHPSEEGQEAAAGERESLWIRPDDLELAGAADGLLVGEVRRVSFRGGCHEVELDCLHGGGAFPVVVRHRGAPVAEGERWAVVPRP